MGALIFYIHYTFLTSGLSSCGVILGVVIKEYSDASSAEIGFLMMLFPFASIFFKPLFCSIADQFQAHRVALIISLFVLIIGFTPFIVVPYFPQFYLAHPRLTWYLLALSSLVGNIGIGVAWSLGDTLALNMMQRTGTPYSRMRLMGTMSWGIYGCVVGQINENPYMPKFVAGFAILHLCVLVEIVALALWNKEDFVMYDPSENKLDSKLQQALEADKGHAEFERQVVECYSGSASASGSVRCHKNTANTLKALLSSAEMDEKLSGLASMNHDKSGAWKQPAHDQGESGAPEKREERSIQSIILRMMLREDTRLIKYLVFCIFVGLFLSPINFLFISLPDVCEQRDCNFSHLAGSMFVTQATVETISFLTVPWAMARISRAQALSFGMGVVLLRFLWYATFFFFTEIPPYWANIGELCHGISYPFYNNCLVETALMFANESKLFIPELRKMGLISERRKGNEKQVEAEEFKIKMSLRATMQSLFSGLMDGFGQGSGNLISGAIAQNYTYFHMWTMFTSTAAVILVTQLAIELSRCKWSDSFDAKPGTKMYEILELERESQMLKLEESKRKRELSVKA